MIKAEVNPGGAHIEASGAAGDITADVLGIVGAVAYDRLVAAKQKPVYTIFGYPDLPDAVRKGDNEVD